MSLNPPKQYISQSLLVAIISLLSGKENIPDSDQLGKLCEKYDLNEYFLIELEEESCWSLILADRSPQESPLWDMMDKYVSAYQNDALEHTDILEGKEGLYHPINVAPFDVSMEATRSYLSQLQQKYGNKFCIEPHDTISPPPPHIRWMECIWYLRKEGELKFEKGHIHLTDKFVSVNIDPHAATEEVAVKTHPDQADLSAFHIKDGYITCRGKRLKFTDKKTNDENFKILRVLLQKNRKVKYEEIWKEVNKTSTNKKARNLNMKEYMKDHASRIRKVVKNFGYQIINQDGYLQITKK